MRVVQEEQAGWYEASLSLQERRKRGHFSTPPQLVERILDACGYTLGSDLRSLRVLDPACGSGNFLAAAARRLVAYASNSGLPRPELLALVQRNLWGFDPDPISCFLAEMQLSAELAPAMAGFDEVLPATTTPFHIHQADGLALPWQEPCVDLFVANPPYLAAKNTDLSAYRSPHQRGQADSYLLFLSLGLRIVRPGGWLGLVLPDPLLARSNASRERTQLLESFTLHYLWHLANVFTAQVGAVVIIAQKKTATIQHHVAWKREKWQYGPQIEKESEGKPCKKLTARTVLQSLFLRQPRAEFRYLLSNKDGQTIERLQAHMNNVAGSPGGFAPLSHLLTISRGEELGMKSTYLSHEETVYSPGLSRDANFCGVSCYPVLRGGKDLRPYQTPHNAWWIAREAISKPLERYLAPKLLVVKSTNRLQATLDVQGHVALQTLYLLHLRTRDACVDDLYFYLALLNSRLLRQYVYVLHTAYKWVQPQIEQHVLARIPVPLVTMHEKQEVIARAKLLVQACSAPGTVVEWDEDIQTIYEEQERVLSALYNALMC